MASKSGAGSSVSSGAYYQASVGAYIIVTQLCNVESIILGDVELDSIGFETTEAVDDINIIAKMILISIFKLKLLLIIHYLITGILIQ